MSIFAPPGRFSAGHLFAGIATLLPAILSRRWTSRPRIAARARERRPRSDAPITLAVAVLGLVACSAPGWAEDRPWLGLWIVDIPAPEIRGDSSRWLGAALVRQVESPATEAGLRLFDIIVEIDRQPISDSHDLACRVAARRPGDTVRFTLVRARQLVSVTVRTAHWPERSPSRRWPAPGTRYRRSGFIEPPPAPGRRTGPATASGASWSGQGRRAATLPAH